MITYSKGPVEVHIDKKTGKCSCYFVYLDILERTTGRTTVFERHYTKLSSAKRGVRRAMRNIWQNMAEVAWYIVSK